MSKNLVEKGNLDKPVTLWNRTYKVAKDWAAQIGSGADAEEIIEEAVKDADIVWSCLASQDAVFACFDKILKTDVKGKLFVESSTVTPEATNKLAERVRDAGAEFISMPGTEAFLLFVPKSQSNNLRRSFRRAYYGHGWKTGDCPSGSEGVGGKDPPLHRRSVRQHVLAL
jgi:hypothetical protein